MLIYYHVIMVKINMKETFKEKIQKLLDTKMDRKDFLKYTAATGLMAMGGGVILKSADHLDILTKQAPKQNIAGGYSADVYGGRKPSSAVSK